MKERKKNKRIAALLILGIAIIPGFFAFSMVIAQSAAVVASVFVTLL